MPSPPRLPTVLVVDGDEAARAALAHMLHLFGHVAIGAADGEEALALARRYAASLMLLVTDVDVPGLAGPVLARDVVGQVPGLPVLFVSGERAPRNLSDAVVGQRAAFLAKPLSIDVLKRALEDLTR